MSLPVPPPEPLPPTPTPGAATGAAAPAEVPVVEVPVVEVPVVDTATRRSHRRHRTWPQRMLLALNLVVILACFGGAGALVVSRYYGNTLNRVELGEAPPATAITGITISTQPGATAAPDGSVVVDVTQVDGSSAPVATFPDADPEAKNFLITGADNNACIDPDSPYAPAFGNRESMGERSDTIMIMRVDPATKRAAILSFPRDLWVNISGRGSKNRINSAYVRDDPTRLIDTIWKNFGIWPDHFIQIDFCAFKTIVDGLGGVAVPFEFPARDVNTGLNVPQAGCFTFDGDHALAYVRSRKYQWMDESGKWRTDPVGDLGRVSRQQDFLRRVLSAALDRGVTDPGVARSLIDAAQKNVVVDQSLTLTRMLEFVGVLRNFEPGGIASYQIQSRSAMVSGNSVQIPEIDGDNMQAILAIFRGEAPLAGAPAQVFDPATTTTTDPDAPTTTVRGSTTTTVVEQGPVDTVVGPEENILGVVPPKDVEC